MKHVEQKNVVVVMARTRSCFHEMFHTHTQTHTQTHAAPFPAYRTEKRTLSFRLPFLSFWGASHFLFLSHRSLLFLFLSHRSLLFLFLSTRFITFSFRQVLLPLLVFTTIFFFFSLRKKKEDERTREDKEVVSNTQYGIYLYLIFVI